MTFRLPPSLPGLGALEEEVLKTALRDAELHEQMEKSLGFGGGMEAVRKLQEEHTLINNLARPEAQIIKEYQDSISGRTAREELLSAAAGGTAVSHLYDALERSSTGADALGAMADRLAQESTGVEAIRRAAGMTGHNSLDLAGAAHFYGTFGSMALRQSELEASLAHAISGRALDSAIAAAMRIEKPWIDSLAPERSFQAFGALSQIGRAIEALRIGDFSSAARLNDLLGTWSPPESFATWEAAARMATYADAGIDMRLFDIPAQAFDDVARAAGIVQPAPEIAPTAPDETHADDKPGITVRKVTISYHGTTGNDAHAQVQSVELLLRYELGWRAPTKYGGTWMKTFVHGNVLAEVKQRQADARLAKSPSLLDYMTFGELVQVIQRKDLWDNAFSDVTMTREEFRVAVERIIELRNAIDHGRQLDAVEFIWVFAEATRLQRAFGLPAFPAEEE
jgi:hypothetical protein